MTTFQPVILGSNVTKWIFSHYAKAGDTILDTHLGSGSSRIAAYDTGFDFIGIEIDRKYFEKQEIRFKEHCAQGSLFEFKGGICV